MTIALINLLDVGGGAARIVTRLAEGLRSRGHVVKILCAYPAQEGSVRLGGGFNRLAGRFFRYAGFADIVMPSTLALTESESLVGVDVVHFHNLHEFYFGITAVEDLARKYPCVWTFHDLWPLTGGCYWAKTFGADGGVDDCEGWRSGCAGCPGVGTYPLVGFARSTQASHEAKRNAIRSLVVSGGRLTAVSQWMADRIIAMGSRCVDPASVSLVRNTVADCMCPADDRIATRQELQIPDGAFVILLAAADLSNPWKGGAVAVSVLLRLLSANMDFIALCVGDLPEKALRIERLKTKATGAVWDPRRMAQLYRCADVTLVPTVAESYSLAVAESIACGTPVVASRVDAIPELVTQGVNGYLFEPGDDFSSSEHIRELYLDRAKLDAMKEGCRRMRQRMFMTEDEWVESYINVYADVVANRNPEQVV